MFFDVFMKAEKNNWVVSVGEEYLSTLCGCEVNPGSCRAIILHIIAIKIHKSLFKPHTWHF